jgi:hypothetical protein
MRPVLALAVCAVAAAAVAAQQYTDGTLNAMVDVLTTARAAHSAGASDAAETQLRRYLATADFNTLLRFPGASVGMCVGLRVCCWCVLCRAVAHRCAPSSAAFTTWRRCSSSSAGTLQACAGIGPQWLRV